jgi:oxygen-dependent protoporphyrinogen oxidase
MSQEGNGSAKEVVIIGGGITGLSAAFYVRRMAADKGIPVHVTIVEKSRSLGGRINTLRKDGFVIEKGPDSFLARKLPIIHLITELGLEEELVRTNPNAKKTYILHDNKLHRMPPGLVLGIPTEVMPFVGTTLLSPAGKARAALDLILPRRQSTDDESLGHFLERRLGSEVLKRIAEPLLAGIYAGDTYNLSVKATFPQFRSLESKHRSLIIGMARSRKTGSEEAKTLPQVARTSTFLTFRNGLVTIVDALAKAIEGTRSVLGTGVEAVRRSGERYEVLLDNGEALHADNVIAALPAYRTAELLNDVPGMERLQAIDYSSVANVVLAYDEKDIDYSFDGTGFVVPRHEGRLITACTWTSSKWQHSSPPGKVLLRCYVGRSGDERWMAMGDDELIASVRHDLLETMGVRAEPEFVEITRMPKSMPQYPVGHLDNIAAVREQLQRSMPGVWVTGAAFHGVGLPDCVRQGKEAAERVVTGLTK